MTGLETAAAILAEQPDQRIILFSAFLDANTRAQASELGILACVPKTELPDFPKRCGDSARVERAAGGRPGGARWAHRHRFLRGVLGDAGSYQRTERR